jgi:hypothetical protein
MTNQYEAAALTELGKAEDVVLGVKYVANTLDSLTFEFGTWYCSQLCADA